MVVYLDFYFLVHFFVNLFCLCFTLRYQNRKIRMLRVLGISLLSAGLSCILIFMRSGLVQLLFAGIQIVGMNVLAEVWQGIKNVFINSMIFTGIACSFAGGCQLLWRAYLLFLGKNTPPTFVLLLFSCGFLGICFLYSIQKMYHKVFLEKNTMNVILSHGKNKLTVNALLDSGNMLRSPYTGEQVAVLSADIASTLELSKNQNPLLIPYSTVSGKGMMSAYRIEKIVFDKQKEKRDVLVAVNQSLDSKKDIQMILSMECF